MSISTRFTDLHAFIDRFSPDSSLLLSAGDDQTAKLWSVRERNCIHTYESFGGPIHAAVFHPSGNYIAAAVHDGSVKVGDFLRLIKIFISKNKYSRREIVRDFGSLRGGFMGKKFPSTKSHQRSPLTNVTNFEKPKEFCPSIISRLNKGNTCVAGWKRTRLWNGHYAPLHWWVLRGNSKNGRVCGTATTRLYTDGSCVGIPKKDAFVERPLRASTLMGLAWEFQKRTRLWNGHYAPLHWWVLRGNSKKAFRRLPKSRLNLDFLLNAHDCLCFLGLGHQNTPAGPTVPRYVSLLLIVCFRYGPVMSFSLDFRGFSSRGTRQRDRLSSLGKFSPLRVRRQDGEGDGRGGGRAGVHVVRPRRRGPSRQIRPHGAVLCHSRCGRPDFSMENRDWCSKRLIPIGTLGLLLGPALLPYRPRLVFWLFAGVFSHPLLRWISQVSGPIKLRFFLTHL